MAKSDADWMPGRPETQTPTEKEKAYRSRQDRRPKNVRLPRGKLKMWEVWCAVNGRDFQDLVEESLDFYFADLDTQASSINSDDFDRSMDFPSSSQSLGGRPNTLPVENSNDEAQKEKEILAFYREAAGARLREKDKEFYRERLANIAPHVIRIGIAQSVIRNALSQNPGQINSLKYCWGAIVEAVEHGTPEKMVAYIEWSLEHRPTYKNSLPPIVRNNLQRAFAGQQMLPGTGGADVVSIDGEGGTKE